MKEFKIKFRTDIDTEELRECIEDGLGVEILEIEGVDKMKTLNLKESINFLNEKCGYIDVENDEDYTEKEIIEIANNKFEELKGGLKK